MSINCKASEISKHLSFDDNEFKSNNKNSEIKTDKNLSKLYDSENTKKNSLKSLYISCDTMQISN